MKVRSGFVSNSSTSSYVILTTKESYDKVIAMLTDLERKAVEAEFQFEKKTIFGKPMLESNRVISREDIGYDWDFLEEDEQEVNENEYEDDSSMDAKREEAEGGLDKFFDLIRKQPDSYATEFEC